MPFLVLDNAEVRDFDAHKRFITLASSERTMTLDLKSADEFRYFDYDDPSAEMARYLAGGFVAWIRLYSGHKLIAALLLYDE